MADGPVPQSDDIWRKRFQIFMGLRLLGLVTFLAGIVLAFTDLIVAGGWPQVGAILAILGAIDMLFAGKLVKRRWDRDDRQ